MLSRLNDALATQSKALVQHPAPIPQPEPQAMRETPYAVVAQTCIGDTPHCEPAHRSGLRTNCKDKTKRCPRSCKYCADGCPQLKHRCPGRTSKGTCRFFTRASKESPLIAIPCPVCVKFSGPNSLICRDVDDSTRGKERICQYFNSDGTSK